MYNVMISMQLFFNLLSLCFCGNFRIIILNNHLLYVISVRYRVNLFLLYNENINVIFLLYSIITCNILKE